MSMIYGFIGAGNMGSALIRALSKHQAGETIAVSDPSAEKVSALSGELGIVPSDNETIASTAEYVVLAVKPQVLPDLLPQLRDELASNSGVTIVTMAAGTSIETVSDLCGGHLP
ncbi:MAG: NAD(P)-binding domain-containing protein, partial [Clostridia bacterium]|nr:NAD(P)-binding domain-containing protein [Clostridia bacterium]